MSWRLAPQLLHQPAGLLRRDPRQAGFEFFGRMRAGQHLDAKPLVRAGLSAFPQRGEKSRLDHGRLARAARTDESEKTGSDEEDEFY
jgi:hypothetical protein